MIAGIGGAYFTIRSVGRFDEFITAGKGFIGLAAMIFGRTPFGAYGASLIFGFRTRCKPSCKFWARPRYPSPPNGC